MNAAVLISAVLAGIGGLWMIYTARRNSLADRSCGMWVGDDVPLWYLGGIVSLLVAAGCLIFA